MLTDVEFLNHTCLLLKLHYSFLNVLWRNCYCRNQFAAITASKMLKLWSSVHICEINFYTNGKKHIRDCVAVCTWIPVPPRKHRHCCIVLLRDPNAHISLVTFIGGYFFRLKLLTRVPVTVPGLFIDYCRIQSWGIEWVWERETTDIIIGSSSVNNHIFLERR